MAGQESSTVAFLIFAALVIPEGSGSHGEKALAEHEEVLAGSCSTAWCLGGDPRSVMPLEARSTYRYEGPGRQILGTGGACGCRIGLTRSRSKRF